MNEKPEDVPVEPPPGFQRVIPTAGDDQAAVGQVEMVSGAEVRPCFMCRSWEKDTDRLIRHLRSFKSVEMRPDGKFVARHNRELDREGLVMDPKNFGFCRLTSNVSEDRASCPHWQPTKRAEDLARKIER